MSFNGDLNDEDTGYDLTNKGSIHTHDSSSNAALAVGANTYKLIANSAETTGLEWVADSSSNADVSAGKVVMAASSTIGDYSTPSSATASSAVVTTDWTWDGTSTGWVLTNNGGTAAIASSQVSLTANSNGDEPLATYDLYSALGSANLGNTWLLRFKVTFSSFENTASGNACKFECGMSDTATISGEDPFATVDSIQMARKQTAATTNGYYAAESWNSARNYTSGATTAQPYTAVRYIEVIRTAAGSSQVIIYTDSAFSIVEETLTLSSFSTNPASLRYLWLRIYYQNVSDSNTVLTEEFKVWNNSITPTGNPASNAVDDNTATYWSSNAETNPWIYADVGSNKNVGNIALYWNSNTTETQVKLQSSTDAAAWTDLRTINSTSFTASQYNYVRFNIAIGRYFRLYGNSGSSYVLALNEIKCIEDSDSQVSTSHGHLAISNSDTSLALDGT